MWNARLFGSSLPLLHRLFQQHKAMEGLICLPPELGLGRIHAGRGQIRKYLLSHRMAGSLGRPTQLLLIASIKGMTTQRALIRELWALGRKLRVETVTLRLLPPPTALLSHPGDGPLHILLSNILALPPSNPRCHLLPSELRPSFPPKKGHPALEIMPL